MRIRSVDVCVAFVYPHWRLPLASVKYGIAACKASRKPFLAYEYGWDSTNYPTQGELRAFLRTLRDNPEVAGDAFWALQAHADDHGWMPVPADTSDPVVAREGESGQWWALYYTGIRTIVNTAGDMAARAQIIREHDYAMRGLRVPAHRIPPAPTITSISAEPAGGVNGVGVRVYWRGSAGAENYTVQRAARSTGPWLTICRGCVTDSDDGFVDLDPVAANGWYRVLAANLDGRLGPASKPAHAPAR